MRKCILILSCKYYSFITLACIHVYDLAKKPLLIKQVLTNAIWWVGLQILCDELCRGFTALIGLCNICLSDYFSILSRSVSNLVTRNLFLYFSMKGVYIWIGKNNLTCNKVGNGNSMHTWIGKNNLTCNKVGNAN